MEDISSLFNYRDPRSLRADQYSAQMQAPSGSLDEMTVQLGGNAGSMIGNALFGGKTSKMAEQAVLNEAIKESEVAEDPDERLKLFAASLRRRGLEGYAQKAEMQLVTRQKTKAEADKAAAAAKLEADLRSELKALPANATPEQVEAIVLKYGDPDKILGVLQKRQDKELTLKAQEEAAKQRHLERIQLAEMNNATRAQIASMNQQYRQELLDMRRDAANEKKEAAEAKQQAAVDMSIRHATKVINDVEEARSLVSDFTTGIPGKASSIVPGTDAFNLNQRVLTLKANLGFDRLQQMRDASPTGGALGQVAVQELEALQASVGSLEVGQSKEELLKNLNKIDEHYKAWLDAVQSANKRASTPSPTASKADTTGWSVKPKTK